MNDGMKKILVVIALLAAIGAVIAAKQFKSKGGSEMGAGPDSGPAAALSDKKLPLLVELGGGTCLPCRQMKPVIAELQADYSGVLKVVYINAKVEESVWDTYSIDMIPTQIFYDAEGNELFRHEGFYSKQQILDQFKGHGIEISDLK